MIKINPSILSKTVKAITPKTEKVKEAQIRGTIVFHNQEHFVQLDGAPSNALTPIANFAEGASDAGFVHGDRVLVLIKNHQAIVTKNLTTGLQAQAAKEASTFTTAITDEGITAQRIIANDTFTNTLRANNITADEIIAGMTTIDTLDANYAHITDGVIDNAKIGVADVNDLSANYAHITTGVIDNAKIDVADVNNLSTNYAHITNGVIDNAKIGVADVNNLSANYAQIDAANVTDFSAQNAWVNKLMVQTGLIASREDVFYLNAIKIDAANITAGTIDVEHLIVTVDGQKYLIHVNPSTGQPTYEKLDGNIVEPRTITADKIVAHDITVQEITTENLVGTNGWINLNQGKFFFTTNGTTWANTTNGIMWDGTNLKIKGDVNITAGNVYTKAEADNKYATQASLTVTNDSIKAEVAAREASDNLLLDSDAPDLYKINAPANRYWSDSGNTQIACSHFRLTDPPEQGIKYGRRFICDGTNTVNMTRAYAFYNSTENDIPYSPNTTYTATWWARCTSGNGKTRISYAKGTGSTENVASPLIDLTSTWQKCTVVFTFGPALNTNFNRIWFQAWFAANTSGTIEICGCKLVPGDAVEQYKTTIEQTANNVLIKATSTGATTAEQQAGGTAAAGLINVTPNTVKISANHVEIDGTATFNAIKSQTDAAYDVIGAATTAYNNAKTYVDGKGYQTASDVADAIPSTVYSGSCGTGGATYDKVVTCKGFALKNSNKVAVSFASSEWNAHEMTLNVNGTGAKPIYVGEEKVSATNRLRWLTGCTITFVYNSGLDNNTGGYVVADNPPSYVGSKCSTAEGTTKKETIVDRAILFKGATLSIPMTNSNTATAVTVGVSNSSGTGFVDTLYFGSGTTTPTKANGYAWPAGATIILSYDGQYWRFGNQTFIDGGNILTGTIAADRIKANVISAVNDGTGQINADKIKVSDISIGSLAGTIGGRNYAATNIDVIPIGSVSTRNGVTATLLGASHFKLNGTSTSTDWFFSASKLFGGMELEVGTYKVWCTSGNVRIRIGSGDNATYVAGTPACTKSSPYTLTVSTKQVYWFTPYCDTSVAYSNQDVKLMVEMSDMPTDWSPAPEDTYTDKTNMLLDWDAASVYKVDSASNRYWSGTQTYFTNTFITLSDPPERGIHSGIRVVLKTAQTAGVQMAYAFYSGTTVAGGAIPMSNGNSYTMSCWARCTSGSGNIRLAYRDDGGVKQGPVVTLTSTWTRVILPFAITNVDYGRVYFYANWYANTTGTVEMCGFKCVSNLDATAYITNIDNNGIRIHPSSTTNNAVLINADGMDVYKGGTSVAMYGETARVGKQSGSHVLTSANQFGMFNSTDEPYFSVTNTGTSRSNECWQGAVIASGATGTLGRFPLKNTSSTVQIRVEDDNGESTTLAGSALSNANVRTNNYSATLTVDGNEVSGNVVVTCTNSSSSPYVTINCKNNLGASAKIFMVYTRTMDIPEINFAGDNKLLWSGMKQMSDIDYIHLNESVSQQLSGIALVWAKSDDSAPNVQFVPKSLVRLGSTSTQGVAVNTIVVQSGFSNIGTKTVYVSDYDIEGHSANAQTSGSGSSISPNHSGSWYLTYVFGV